MYNNPIDHHGDVIRAVVSGGDDDKPIMLCGYFDTVSSTRGVCRWLFSISDDKALGSGVADMRSGLIINTFILVAFQKFSGHPKPLVALFTWDKKIGSPASKDAIMAEEKNDRLALNSEPGWSNGNIIIGRKGGIFFNCEIVGVAAHFDYFFEQERSAI